MQPPRQAQTAAQPGGRPRRAGPAGEHAVAEVAPSEHGVRPAQGRRGRASSSSAGHHRTPEKACMAWYHPIGESHVSAG